MQSVSAEARARGRGAELASKFNSFVEVERRFPSPGKTCGSACSSYEVNSWQKSSLATKRKKQQEEASEKAKAAPASEQRADSTSRSVAQSAVIAPTLPVRSLAAGLEGTDTQMSCLDKTPSGKFSCPDATPTAAAPVVDNMLRKSELLLAELTALGLADQTPTAAALGDSAKDDFCFACDTEEEDEHSTADDEFSSELPQLAVNAESALTKTIEVPVALLDMFNETLLGYRQLQALQKGQLGDGTESLATQEPESESGVLSSTGSSVVMEEFFVEDASSPQAAVAPSAPMQSAQSGVTTAVRAMSPPRAMLLSPAIASRPPASSRKSIGSSSCPLQWYLQVSPPPPVQRTAMPSQAAMTPRRASVPRVAVNTPLSRCRPVSCTVEQTVTITNTVRVKYEVS
jgi:hypothetical protein